MEIINAYISFIRRLGIKFRKKKNEKNEAFWTKLTHVVITQANRKGIEKAVKTRGRWSMIALADANELERAAWRIIGLYSDAQSKDSNEITVHMLKNRSGQVIPEPFTTYFEPKCNVVGEDVQGFLDMLSLEEFTGTEGFGDKSDFGDVDIDFDFMG